MDNEIARLKEENEKLKNLLLHFIGWAEGGACNDCTPFREAPSDISYVHHKDCAYLALINKTSLTLGYPLNESHDRLDAEADMVRMANERYQDCLKKGLIKC